MSYPKLTPVIAKGATEPRYLEDRFTDVVNVKDFGVKGDGETDDTAAFKALEDVYTGRHINLLGKTYVVDIAPRKNYYYNGKWYIKYYDDLETVVPNKYRLQNAWDNDVYKKFGSVHNVGAGTIGHNYVIINNASTEDVASSNLKDVIALGEDTLKTAIGNHGFVSGCVAIGRGVMSEGEASGYQNIGIGNWALHNLTTGDRNIAIGSLSMLYGDTITKCVALGRDTAQTIKGGSAHNVFLGYGAVRGDANSIGSTWLDKLNEIECQNCIFIGADIAEKLSGYASGVTAIGGFSLPKCKLIRISTLVGASMFPQLGAERSTHSKPYKEYSPSKTGSYLGSEDKLIVTPSDSSVLSDFVVGGSVWISIPDSIGGPMEVVSKTETTVTLQCTTIPGSDVSCMDGISGSDITIEGAETSTSSYNNEYSYRYCANVGADGFVNVNNAFGFSSVGIQQMKNSSAAGSASQSELFGYQCAYSAKSVSNSVVVGTQAGYTLPQIDDATIIGYKAAYNANGNIYHSVFVGDNAGADTTGSNTSVDIGYTCGPVDNTSYRSVHIGAYAGRGNVADASSKNVAIGYGAMSSNPGASGSEIALTNCTCLGCNSQVSGSNQVQLGDSSTTTYAYGAVQDRSDARDKTDIRDTQLGLDFLLQLRPVDFRWDYRDSYVNIVEKEIESVDEEGNKVVETVSEIIPVEKDGSRKRNRFHHGLIAQEVKAVLDKNGIDFGGYQDHSINGGKDVLTLGYEEFIAPLIKSIQELNSKVEQLEERIRQLTNSNN